MPSREATEPASSSLTESEISSLEAPPDGKYGWVCVLSCFLINTFTWGITASYGVYLSHYLDHNTFPEATSTDFAFIGGFNFSAAMVVSPLVTYLTRNHGKHCTMAIGVVFQAAGYILASFSQRIWQLYISQGVLVGLGTGFLYIPSTAILSQWFSKRRSLANGISAAGTGVGGAIFSWATGAMIESLSVPWALRITAVIGILANTIATTLIRDRNKYIRPPQLAFDMHLLARLDVLLLLSWAFVSMFGYIVLLFSMADFAISINLSASQSTTIVGLLNVGMAVGRPIIGLLSDRFRRIDVAATLTIVCGLLCFILWLPVAGYGSVIVFAVLIGAVLGVFWMTIGPLCVEIVELKHLPSLLSIVWLIIVIPTTFSEAIALGLRRKSGTRVYLYTQIFAGLSYLIAGVFMLILGTIKRREERPSKHTIATSVSLESSLPSAVE